LTWSTGNGVKWSARLDFGRKQSTASMESCDATPDQNGKEEVSSTHPQHDGHWLTMTFLQALTFHQRLSRIREKIFRNDEAGLCLEGFLDALADGQEDPEAADQQAANKYLTPVRGSPRIGGKGVAGVKDRDARVKADLCEYRQLMVNRRDFEEVATLGYGHFASVHLVRERKAASSAASGGKCYAMKKMAKASVTPERARMERTVMSKAKSDWIVGLKFAFQDAKFLYLVMEYCPGGDLRTLLDRHDGKLSEDMARFYLAEMTLAIHTLHQMGYVHRDIKPENVLIDRFGHIKLTDFGSVDLVTSKAKTGGRSARPVGTPNYVSPEILQCLDDQREEFDPRKSDFWSMGVVGFEMVTGHTPFADDSNSVVNTYANIMGNKFNMEMTKLKNKELRDLLGGLLTDVEKRFGYDQLVRHEFFLSVDWDGLGSSCSPFVPDLKNGFDTSYFDEGRNVNEARSRAAAAKPCENVVGFSYAGKHAESVRYSRQFGGEDYSDMASSLRRQNEDLRLRLARLEKERKMERHDSAVKLEREVQRKNKEEAKELRATVKELERLLAVEREERSVTEKKSLELLTEVRKKWQEREEARVEKVQEKLRKAEARREILEAELKTSVDTAESQQREIKALTEVKNGLKAKLKECKAKLEATYDKYEEECQKVKEMKEQSSLAMETECKSFELEKSLLEKDVASEKERVQILQAEVARLKKDAEQASRVNRDQKETIQFMRSEREMADAEHLDVVKELKRERRELAADKERLQSNVHSLERDREVASVKLTDKDRKLEQLGQMLERLESKIKPVDRLPPACDAKELQEAKDELGLQKVEMRLLEKKNKELEERIKWRIEMMKDDKVERQNMEKELNEAKEKVKKAEEEVEKAMSAKERAEMRLPALESEVKSLKEQLKASASAENDAREAKFKLESVEARLKVAEADREKTSDLKQSNKELKAACMELQDQQEKYESMLERLEKNLEAATSGKEKLHAEAAELSRSVSELRVERNELKSKLIFAETQLKESRAKQEDVEALYKQEEAAWSQRLTQSAGAKEEQGAALRKVKEQLEMLASSHERANLELAALREQNLELSEEAAEQRTSAHSLKESNLKLNAVMEEMLGKIERRNNEISSLRERLAALAEDKDKRENENGVHIEQLKKLIEHLRGKNDALEAQLFKSGKGKKRPAETLLQPEPRTPLRSSPKRHAK